MTIFKRRHLARSLSLPPAARVCLSLLRRYCLPRGAARPLCCTLAVRITRDYYICTPPREVSSGWECLRRVWGLFASRGFTIRPEEARGCVFCRGRCVVWRELLRDERISRGMCALGGWVLAIVLGVVGFLWMAVCSLGILIFSKLRIFHEKVFFFFLFQRRERFADGCITLPEPAFYSVLLSILNIESAMN